MLLKAQISGPEVRITGKHCGVFNETLGKKNTLETPSDVNGSSTRQGASTAARNRRFGEVALPKWNVVATAVPPGPMYT